MAFNKHSAMIERRNSKPDTHYSQRTMLFYSIDSDAAYAWCYSTSDWKELMIHMLPSDLIDLRRIKRLRELERQH